MKTGIALSYALSFIVLLTALADLILGSLVLIDSPRRKINRLYALLSTVISAGGIAFLGVHFSHDSQTFEVWSYIYAASLLFAPPLYYHMVLGSIGYPLQDYNSRLSIFCERVKQLSYVFSAGWLGLTMSGVFPPP